MTEPSVTVFGDAVGGFIVDLHDGDRAETHVLFAADADAARIEGLARFHASAPVGAAVAQGG